MVSHMVSHLECRPVLCSPELPLTKIHKVLESRREQGVRVRSNIEQVPVVAANCLAKVPQL